jgi:hypothetical protein
MKYHVHVYKVSDYMQEIEIDDAKNLVEARQKALDIVKTNGLKNHVDSDCHYIAIAFEVDVEGNTTKTSNS